LLFRWMGCPSPKLRAFVARIDPPDQFARLRQSLLTVTPAHAFLMDWMAGVTCPWWTVLKQEGPGFLPGLY